MKTISTEKQNWKTAKFNEMLEQYAEDLNYTKDLDDMLWLFIRESSTARSYPSYLKRDFEEAAYSKLTNILLGIDLRKTDRRQMDPIDLKKKLKRLIDNGNGLGGYLRVHLIYVSMKFRRKINIERINQEQYIKEIGGEIQNGED